ncbi:zinc finger protein GAI-ASSOCIATED FACTOR 1-like [Tripterygium wilfordii]|uniref:zinc finger protein GAI-ASSOCIATED FACTOR 1-like n=1 Tax=Tripterygium wilfordii TaxID=458696 RepID=UPI0018F833EB|nr:zinc finger protein GAI-ASSOCIATED FACTOR 1-like [Tripterygium wilfordii]
MTNPKFGKSFDGYPRSALKAGQLVKIVSIRRRKFVSFSRSLHLSSSSASVYDLFSTLGRISFSFSMKRSDCLKMSSLLQEFEEDELLQSTMIAHSSINGSPNASQTCNEISPSATKSSKKKRNLSADSDVEVVALSPRTLTATNRYICEVCHKGFQRDQNLQLHRRGHNLPWKLKQRPSTQTKRRVYICPEPSCVHHDPSKALGDLTGIKKHFCRKHGEKKWKCDKCSKCYAVQSDWKAHTKICGTREHRCGCGTIFSR